MSLPRQVAQQGERAEAILAEHLKQHSGNTEQPAPAQAQAPVAPPEAPKEQAAPAAAPATPPAAPAAPAAPAVDWEQRYKVLQGKYNAEVTRAQAEAKAAKEAQAKTEERLAALEAESRKKPLVTDEEVKEFGEPLVDMARRLAREENRVLVEANEKLQAQVAELSARVGQTAQVGAQLNTQSFYRSLDAAHADWRSVNDDPAFLSWLDGVDPLYGKPRQALLDEAQDALDAGRVAAFFTAFKADVQSRAAPRQAALEEQVTPSSSAGAVPTTPQKKIWTSAEITKFYDDVRRKRIPEADAARIEQDIHLAQREGRYRAK